MESEIKRTRPKEISSFDLGERESKHGEERRKEEEEEEEEEDHRYGTMIWYRKVWNLSMGVWKLWVYGI